MTLFISLLADNVKICIESNQVLIIGELEEQGALSLRLFSKAFFKLKQSLHTRAFFPFVYGSTNLFLLQFEHTT